MGLTMEVLIVTMKKGGGDKCGPKNFPTIRLQMTTLIKLLLVEATVSCLTWRVVFFIHYLLPVLRRAVSLIRCTELANRGCTSQWINQTIHVFLYSGVLSRDYHILVQILYFCTLSCIHQQQLVYICSKLENKCRLIRNTSS